MKQVVRADDPRIRDEFRWHLACAERLRSSCFRVESADTLGVRASFEGLRLRIDRDRDAFWVADTFRWSVHDENRVVSGAAGDVETAIHRLVERVERCLAARASRRSCNG